MKRVFKKMMMAMACLMIVSTAAIANGDKPIEKSKLPMNAQHIIYKHYANQKVAMATVERGVRGKEYDVVFANGNKIEFDKNGNWKSIEDTKQVPSALIPVQIINYLDQTYPKTKIRKIEKDKKMYEVELSNGLEITFNKNYLVTKIDE